MIAESSVFRNEEILSTEYLPELLPHREQQTKEMADNLEPAAKKRTPQNTFVFGSPGIGKTASARFVFREFENYSGIKTFYINCWDYNSVHSIFSKIAQGFQSFVQRRGMSKDEIIERVVEACKKSGKSLLICLDEVDQLVFKDNEALYDLLRINQYIKNQVGIIFISNNQNVFMNVEPRIKSSLNIEEIEFKPYSLEEMKDILKERAEIAFSSIDSSAILLAANHAVNNGGDVRVGLEALMKAGREAEKENSKKVSVDHMKRILTTVKEAKPEIIKQKINEDERIILNVVNEKKKIYSNELYEIYSSNAEAVSERRFRDFVNHLNELKMIKIVDRKRGVKGKRRLILKA